MNVFIHRYTWIDKFLNFRKSTLLTLLLIFTVIQCSSSRLVRPLPKGEIEIGASLGGPLIANFGFPMPLPLSSVYGAYGIHEKVSVYSALQLTDLAFGVVHLEGGGLYALTTPDGALPGISVVPGFHVMVDVWEYNWKFYPVADIMFYWNVGWGGAPKHMWYTGLTNWFELASQKAYHRTQTERWIYGIVAGYRHVFSSWFVGAEVKYLSPHINTLQMVPEYLGISHQGAYGFYITGGRKF